MKKVIKILAFTSLASSLSLAAHADVIKPINQNSAVKIILPLATDEYYDFTMTLDGRVVKVGEEIPVDGPKCLDFQFGIKDLRISYYTKYCGQFQVGKTTEIMMPALQLTGPKLKPDTLFAVQTHPFTFSTRNQSRVGIARLAHDFALPKLVPFLTSDTDMTVEMPLKSLKIAKDPASHIFKLSNPSDSRPDMIFTRVGQAVFPDAAPLRVFMQRSGTYSTTFVTALRNVFDLKQPVQVFSWLKLPWDSNDSLSMCQVSADGGNRPVSYQIGGVDALAKPVSSNYPTMVNINRIDVDDVTVNSADGRVSVVPGKYSIRNTDLNFDIVSMAKTKTGMDVLPGNYVIAVYYQDPFTMQNESKIYNLTFQ